MLMTQDQLITALEDLARRLDYQIRYENLQDSDDYLVKGGGCVVAGAKLILVDKRSSKDEKIEVFTKALYRESLEEIFIMPQLRQYFEKND